MSDTQAAPDARATTRSRPGRSYGWAFPLVLWFFATFFYLGNLGKWLDDYVLSLRDPVTGDYRLPVWPWTTYSFFYRPLHLAFVYHAQTLLWNHDWLNHLINALCHGLVTLLLWCFLRSVTRSPHAAAAGAILFMVYPLHYEVIFWPSAVNASIATAIFLCLAMMYMRHARRGDGGRLVWLMALIAFVIPCWNEQPATGIVALPLLCRSVRRSGVSYWGRLKACLWPAVLCGLACLVYVLLVRATAPPWARGSAGSFTEIHALGERAAAVARGVEARMFEPWVVDILHGGIIQARTVLGAAGLGLYLIALLVTAALWLRYGWQGDLDCPDEAKGGPRPGRLRILLFGLAIFLAAWLPVLLLKTQIIEPRICYFPSLGLAIAGAAIIDQWAAWCAGNRVTRGLFKAGIGIMVIGLSLPCALSLVGVQSALRERYRLDQLEMTQLKSLVPDPPPETVFVPLDVADMPARTGVGNFDRFAIGALGTRWSAKAIVEQTYRRCDVYCTKRSWWSPLALRDFDASSAADPASGTRIPWSRMVPFIVDADGKLHLVSIIRIERANQDDWQVSLPHVQALLQRRGLPDRIFAIGADADDEGREPLSGWEWVTTGQPVAFRRVSSWQSFRLCAAMHPVHDGERDLAMMRTALPAADKELRLQFRATFAEHDPNQGQGDGVELIWYLDGQRDALLARLGLPPGRLAADQRWFSVFITIPPHGADRHLYMEVLPGPAGDASYDLVRVTIGCRLGQP